MTPKDTITVPADAVVDLRTALYTQIGAIVEVLDSLTLRSDREHHPQRYHQPLQNLDRIRSLLDTIGWQQPNRPISVVLNLREHRRALVGALHMALTLTGHPGPTAVRDTTAPTDEAVRERACVILALLLSTRERA